MKMIKQNVHTWHGKETHFTLVRNNWTTHQFGDRGSTVVKVL